jgi:uncharacterized protein (TIGR00730 family)
MHTISGRKMNMNVFVGCSCHEIEEYKEIAYGLGEEIAKKGHTLVFGGSYLGLMKNLADGAIDNKGDLIGVIPNIYKQLAYNGCKKLIVTDTVCERKLKMYENCDACIFLPGGFGTLDELIGILEEKRAGCMNIPIVVINHKGHFNKFIEYVNELITGKYAKSHDFELIKFVNSIDEAMDEIGK